jgi:Type IV secretion system pilin
MINKIKTLFLAIFASSALLIPVLVPVTAHAALDQQLCSGANLDINATSCNVNDPTSESKVNSVVTLVINLFSVIVGLIAVIMIIVGGIKYITSGGESSNVSGAKNTILYAIVGLVVVALAQVIVRFVLSKLSTTG